MDFHAQVFLICCFSGRGLMEFIWSILSFRLPVFCALPVKSLPRLVQGTKIFMHVLFWSCICLALIFQCVIHYELFTGSIRIKGLFLYLDVQLFQSRLGENLSFPHRIMLPLWSKQAGPYLLCVPTSGASALLHLRLPLGQCHTVFLLVIYDGLQIRWTSLQPGPSL